MSPVIGGWFPQPATAQAYPSGPIHIIVPFAAGGLVDAWRGSPAREWRGPWANRSSSKMGRRQFNRRHGRVRQCDAGRAYVTPATADALSYNPQLFAKLPYDPEKSFAPVIMMALTNNLLVANIKAPFKTYKEMIAYAKANPGKLNWGTWGPGTLPDLYLRWISSQAGVNIQAIPYKGGAVQANPAVYSGEVDITYMGFGVAGPQIAAGTIKPLVALGSKPSSSCRTCRDWVKKAAILAFRAIWACGLRPARRNRSCSGSTPSSRKR